MPSPKYQVYGIRETYHELGQYQFKVVLNPRFYKTGHDFRVEMFDSSNRPMNFKFEIWGRKINITFEIDDYVSDGVAQATVFRGNNQLSRFTFWVIKP
jgi:hypothetical protein